MIDHLILGSLRHRMLVLTCSALLLGWGIYETRKMPIDVFPDLTAPTVTVVTEAHGMAPEEVESLITFQVETALYGASGVRRVRSATGVGISVVWVEFDWGTDIYHARQVVSEKIQLARNTLPPEIEPPVLAPVSSIMGEIMFIGLSSETHSPMELKTTADWVLRRRLLAVPGVSQVFSIGGDTQQFQVVVDPSQLAAHRVTLDQVLDAVASANENTSAGFIVEGGQEYLIQGRGRIQTLEDLLHTQVAMVDGQPILLTQMARVTVGAAMKRGDGGRNGKTAVILGIQKQPDANTLELTTRIDATLAEIQTNLPKGMTLDAQLFRQSDFIEVAVANVRSALRDGALLVVLIVGLFLGSGRATAITVLAIPLSLVTAVLFLQLFGESINTMTLGGMAIAIGALVDDAIIDVENVARRLRENRLLAEPRPNWVVVFEASKEIRVSIVFATLIIVLVFLPLFGLSGVEGRLLRPLGFSYVVALFASLITALTVTPALCSLLLTGSRILQTAKEPVLVAWLKRRYAPVLAQTLTRWRLIVSLGLVLTAAALIAITGMGRSFLPDFNEGSLTLSVVTLPGTSLEESVKLGRLVEEILRQQPEVISTARRTGRAELDEHAQGVNASEIDVRLAMKDRSKAELLDALRSAFTMVPGANIVIGQPISHRIDHMLSGTRANIAVKIFGPDLLQLRQLGDQAKTLMATVPGAVDLALEEQSDIPYIYVTFDRAQLARHGLQVRQVAEAIETSFAGRKVSQVLVNQAAFDLVVRMEPSVLEGVDRLGATPITTPLGSSVPLASLARIRKDLGPNMISRENVQRKMVVMSNVSGRDLGSVAADIQKTLAQNLQLPEGYHISLGGQFESAESASRTLLALGVVSIVGIFLLLYLAVGTGRDALLVMVNLPFALIGGVLGVYVTGGTLSIASIIGFITLFGIATRNGILLVSHIHQLLDHEGVVDLKEAVSRAALERLSPILMTALSAGLALVPLVFKADQPGGEIEAPMAVVILFGLMSSTLLNAVMVPALYCRFGARRNGAPQEATA